jgi:hypothetical protein
VQQETVGARWKTIGIRLHWCALTEENRGFDNMSRVDDSIVRCVEWYRDQMTRFKNPCAGAHSGVIISWLLDTEVQYCEINYKNLCNAARDSRDVESAAQRSADKAMIGSMPQNMQQ